MIIKMTSSNHDKVLKQISDKPAKLAKYKKYNVPKSRKTGKNVRRCRRCARRGAHIGKYGLGYCRQCFRQLAQKIGFKKFN
jgi:small subunit ribosomal protein S14